MKHLFISLCFMIALCSCNKVVTIENYYKKHKDLIKEANEIGLKLKVKHNVELFLLNATEANQIHISVSINNTSYMCGRTVDDVNYKVLKNYECTNDSLVNIYYTSFCNDSSLKRLLDILKTIQPDYGIKMSEKGFFVDMGAAPIKKIKLIDFSNANIGIMIPVRREALDEQHMFKKIDDNAFIYEADQYE